MRTENSVKYNGERRRGSRESAREKYKNTLDHFNYHFSQLKKGDIIVLSSRYEVRWGNHPTQSYQFTYYDSNNKILSRDESYKRWKSLFDNIAEKSLSKGIKIVVFNAIPTFPSVSNERQWFNQLQNTNFGLKRDHLIKKYQPVDSAFNSLASKYSNVEVFDIFSELCPKSQIFCTNKHYRDQSHISSKGALSLYGSLLKKLN